MELLDFNRRCIKFTNGIETFSLFNLGNHNYDLKEVTDNYKLRVM